MVHDVDRVFEAYFYQRATVADGLTDLGWALDACTLAAAAIDALASIWLGDFPEQAALISAELGGALPASIRLTRFVKRFSAPDSNARNIAVVCFAEDWKRHDADALEYANRLLEKRTRKYCLPFSHLDVDIDRLLVEAPELSDRPGLIRMSEDYEYGALIYSLYRCPLIHQTSLSRRTHGFARGEEVMYMAADAERTTISFGPKLITRWLRESVSGYVRVCAERGIRPAGSLVPGLEQEDKLQNRWQRLLADERSNARLQPTERRDLSLSSPNQAKLSGG
jgi:hypothetical protein